MLPLAMLACWNARSQTITYGGVDTSVSATENWSSPNVTKAYSLGGIYKCGTAGYYQIFPNLGGSANTGVSVGAGNDLEITASSYALLAAHASEFHYRIRWHTG